MRASGACGAEGWPPAHQPGLVRCHAQARKPPHDGGDVARLPHVLGHGRLECQQEGLQPVVGGADAGHSHRPQAAGQAGAGAARVAWAGMLGRQS